MWGEEFFLRVATIFWWQKRECDAPLMGKLKNDIGSGMERTLVAIICAMRAKNFLLFDGGEEEENFLLYNWLNYIYLRLIHTSFTQPTILITLKWTRQGIYSFSVLCLSVDIRDRFLYTKPTNYNNDYKNKMQLQTSFSFWLHATEMK